MSFNVTISAVVLFWIASLALFAVNVMRTMRSTAKPSRSVLS